MCHKIFFSVTRAEAFAKELKHKGGTDIRLLTDTDTFKQTVYVVKWNI